MENMENKLNAKIRIHLYTTDKCFGPGICTLLNEVDKSGSLRKASINMGMAYSKAWKIVKQCEKSLGFELLTSSTGGKNGGGALLTDEAKIFISTYEEYINDIENYAKIMLEKKFQFYNNK